MCDPLSVGLLWPNLTHEYITPSPPNLQSRQQLLHRDALAHGIREALVKANPDLRFLICGILRTFPTRLLVVSALVFLRGPIDDDATKEVPLRAVETCYFSHWVTTGFVATCSWPQQTAGRWPIGPV